jgi:hypothetical protein
MLLHRPNVQEPWRHKLDVGVVRHIRSRLHPSLLHLLSVMHRLFGGGVRISLLLDPLGVRASSSNARTQFVDEEDPGVQA